VRSNYTILNDREIAGTGLGTSPAAVRAFADLQDAVYQDQPGDTAAVQEAATAAQGAADAAGTAAAGAQESADAASDQAMAARKRADDAYALADTKVSKNVGPTWTAPTAPQIRTAVADYSGTASATYTQAEVQTLMDRVQALTRQVAALVTDGRGNGSLRAS